LLIVVVLRGVSNQLKAELDVGVKFLEALSCLVFGGSIVLYSDSIGFCLGLFCGWLLGLQWLAFSSVVVVLVVVVLLVFDFRFLLGGS
jgi:hypothetical protein